MEIIRNIREMTERCTALRCAGAVIGFVPTMGALHRGHLSLLEIARKDADTAIMSIYVNPTQFGPNEDFRKYPRPFEEDCRLAESAGCTILFAPSSDEMYPESYHTFVTVQEITDRLCGASRPGHFRGVATVVLKFLNIVRPYHAVFGQKDGQQVLVIRRMIDDLNLDVKLVVAPTVREPDGLALSSRNAYLKPEERAAAPLIRQGLLAAIKLYESGDRRSATLKTAVEDSMRKSPLLRPEYIELVDTRTVAPVDVVGEVAMLAIACRTTETNTRLIDNTIFGGTL